MRKAEEIWNEVALRGGDPMDAIEQAQQEAIEEAAKAAEAHAAEYNQRRADAESVQACRETVLAHHRYYETLLATAHRIRDLIGRDSDGRQ